jgi:hypothetical protein
VLDHLAAPPDGATLSPAPFPSLISVALPPCSHFRPLDLLRAPTVVAARGSGLAVGDLQVPQVSTTRSHLVLRGFLCGLTGGIDPYSEGTLV